MLTLAFTLLTTLSVAGPTEETAPNRLTLLDVFELEYASDPRISPDGLFVAYVRNFMDVKTDRRRSNLWIVSTDGADHRPLTSGNDAHSQPRWSPDGSKLAYVTSASGSAQIHVRWMDTGQHARLTNLNAGPAGLTWSPDGTSLAFTMLVEEETKPFVTPPTKPEGAEWADPPKVITTLRYRADGAGYLKRGHRQLFVLPADGGTPRQLTRGAHDIASVFSWAPDGRSIFLSSNRREDSELEPLDSEIYSLSLEDGSLSQVTDHYGPDDQPAVSPDGTRVAYVGFDDTHQGYRVRRLWICERDGSREVQVVSDLDRSVRTPHWSADGSLLYYQYDDRGDTKVASVALVEPDVASYDSQGNTEPLRLLGIGGPTVLAARLGGESLGRPYAAGSYTVSNDGHIAFTRTTPAHPADVAVRAPDGGERVVTHLNRDLLSHKELGPVEEVWCESSADGRKIQSWLMLPPGLHADERYPLILEIHGGPFANYGPRFSAECQLYAAAGYAVLYVNPRGSTSYGETFGNLIHHAYPGDDYHDLISAVDAVIARGFIDSDKLFVTGGSGGGVLTSWIVGKTDRFAAAVVAKPVINWTSFALTADMYNFFYKYWFPGPPWAHPEHYWERSPLSLVGNVKTPTMVLTGEADYRTPMSESEQYYQALKLLGVDAALVRVPDASHGIAKRPSHLIAKVAHVLKWFELHGGTDG
jgi:acylaminoacyl-peptidase